MRNGDLVFSYAANYVLPDRVENLQLRGAGNINGTGNAERNVIVGNTGNNRVDGSGGDDQLFDQEPQYAGSPYYALDADLLLGGDGNDTLTSHFGSDVLDGGAGNDTFVAYGRVALIQGGDGNDTITASGGGDLIDGGAGDDSINGWGAVATLAGGTGNDTLTGSGRGSVLVFNRGDGDDTLSPGFNARDGQDRLVFGTGVAAADVTMERVGTDGNDLLLRLSDGGGSVLVRSYFAASVPDGYRNYALASIEFADGTVWRRNAVDGYFGLPVDPEGTDGDDILVGTAARNVLYAHGGNDQVAGQAGSDDLFGGTGDDMLLGEDGNDTLYGEAGNDVLDGGLGYDVLIGGAGDDTYRDADGSFSISEGVGEGTDTQEIGTSGSLSQNVENGIIVTTTGGTVYGNELNNTLVGNAGADRLEGGAGNDLLDGTAGADTMLGGAGDDRYIVDNASDVTTENANEGNDTVESSVTRTLGANLENLTLTGTAAINGTGNSLANVIVGNAANNMLNGGTGGDTLRGGAGNDTYVVDNAGDVVQELPGEGTDLVQASVNFTLSTNVENLTLTGTSGLTGIGNDEDNTLTGNSGANRLEGRGGNDTLNGGTGADTMLGGLGDDVYVVDSAGDVVTENANEGVDRVQSSISYTLGNNVENLTLTGTGAINGTGNVLDNVLIGNSGNNTLSGGAGNDRLDGGSGTDTLAGGTGDDTYVLNASTGKTLTENANEGTDTVESSVTHTLLTNFEHLVLTGTNAINGTGNAANNHLRGNVANNTLNGSGGNDVLQGGAGNDTLTDTSGRGVHDGADGTDTLTGGTDRQFFAGGAGNDTLTLGGGADIIAFNRGQGADIVNAPTAGAGQGETNDTVSLAGVRYSELRLARSGNDLYVKVAGTTDSIRLTGWYAATGNRTVSTLQMIVDSTADYDAGSSDPLVNRRVARLNFQTLVNAFDAAYAANPSIGDWAIPSTTLNSGFVAGSDADAIGGQLAYRYGRDGHLAGLDFATATSVLADANFGTAAQSIGSGPTSGGVRLMRVSATAPETGALDGRVATGSPLLGRSVPLTDDAQLTPTASKPSAADDVAAVTEHVGLPRFVRHWIGAAADEAGPLPSADGSAPGSRSRGALSPLRRALELIARRHSLLAGQAVGTTEPALAAIEPIEIPDTPALVPEVAVCALGPSEAGDQVEDAPDGTTRLAVSKVRPLTAAVVDAAISGSAHWGTTNQRSSMHTGFAYGPAPLAADGEQMRARWQRIEAYLHAEQRSGQAGLLGGEDLVDTMSTRLGVVGAAIAVDDSQRSLRAARRTMIA